MGHVRLGFTGPASYEVLLVLTRAFRRHRPDVRLEIVGPAYSGELVDRLRRADMDTALVQVPVSTEGLALRELTSYAIGAALPATHPLAEQTAVTLEQLADQPLIGYPSNRGVTTADIIHGTFLQHGKSPHIVQEAPDTHTIMLLAGAGVGIGLVPISAGHLKVPGVVLLPVSDIPPVGLAPAWRADDVNPALRALVELLDETEAEYANG